jgi:hypothetical protein
MSSGDKVLATAMSTGARVTFRAKHSGADEAVCVVGNLPELGSWGPEKAVHLAPAADDPGIFEVSLNLRALSETESESAQAPQYKYLIRDSSGALRWEPGFNRDLSLPACSTNDKSLKQVVVCDDVRQDGALEMVCRQMTTPTRGRRMWKQSLKAQPVVASATVPRRHALAVRRVVQAIPIASQRRLWARTERWRWTSVGNLVPFRRTTGQRAQIVGQRIEETKTSSRTRRQQVKQDGTRFAGGRKVTAEQMKVEATEPLTKQMTVLRH